MIQRTRRKTYNAVNNSLLLRELHKANFRVRRREGNDGAVENSSLHRAAHHGVRKECRNATLAVTSIGVAEVLLEGLQIHGIVGFEEAEVWEKSGVSIVSPV